MSTETVTKPVTIQLLAQMKAEGEKISMITAYDYTMAGIMDQAGIDMILVGDSAANVMAGHQTTVPFTVDEMIYHGSCVARGVKRAMVIIDMPFGSYQGDPIEGLHSAVRIMKQTGANGVKLEGGAEIADSISKILAAGIPVMGHLGLTPQSINKFGTFGLRAKEKAEADKLLSDAKLLEKLGCFSLVLEKIPAALAEKVTKSVNIPVIGIGAGNAVDGQVLVSYDMLGLTKGFSPKFLRRYADLNTIVTDAVGRYIADVKSGDFPNENEQY